MEAHLTDGVRGVSIAVDPGTSLSTAWLETRLAEDAPSVAILSPFFSLFAGELAQGYVQTHFVAIGPGSDSPNLTRVVIGQEVAYVRAARLIAEYVESAEDPPAIALFLSEHTDPGRERSQVLRTALADAGVRPAVEYRYPSSAGRDELRADVRAALSDGASLFVVLAGAENGTAMDLLSEPEIRIVTEHQAASGAREDQVLFSVEYPLAAVIELARSRPAAGTVTVDAVLLPGAAATAALLNVIGSDAEDITGR